MVKASLVLSNKKPNIKENSKMGHTKTKMVTSKVITTITQEDSSKGTSKGLAV